MTFATFGCAKHASSPQINPPAPIAAAAHPTDCAIDEGHYASLSNLIAAPPIRVKIERIFQNVVHHDCNGVVIKSGVETVQSPTEVVKYNLPTEVGSAGAIRLFNDTSCDWSSAELTDRIGSFAWTNRLRGTRTGQLEITLDVSKGETSFHVKPGINTIYYTYYSDCVPESARHSAFHGECPSTTELSSGSFTVDVNYSELTLPGDKNNTDCQR